MNNKRRIFSLLFSLFLLVGSAPAWAVSPNTNWFANRENFAGTTFTNMSASATTFCYLSRVGVRETDTAGELTMCRVTRGSLVWTLEAILGASSDADVYCSAYCYNN